VNPAREYRRLQSEIRVIIERLPGVLNAHVAHQEEHPDHWSFVGDLKKVRLDLVHILAFLGDYDAKEEVQFIAKSGGEPR